MRRARGRSVSLRDWNPAGSAIAFEAEASAAGRWAWLLPVLAGAASAWASWQRWIDPFLDCGREMNVPARLAAGERLYRDIVYYYGPAGPWLDAAALSLFGRRLLVLEIVSLGASLLLFTSLWSLTERAGGRLAACLAVTWAAALCVGAPNGGSFLFPYSFDALFGLAGALLCLALCTGPASWPRNALAAAGLAVALAAKPEIGAAAAALLAVAALRLPPGERDERRRLLRVAAKGAVAALLLWAAAFAGVAWKDLSPEGPFALFSPPAEWRNVYRVISGLADPAASAAAVLTALFLDLAILAGALALAKISRGAAAAAEALWYFAIAGVSVFLASSGARIEDRLAPLLSPVPLVAAIAALGALRAPLDPGRRARFLLFGFSAAVGSRVALGLAYGAVTTPYSILAVPALAASAAVLALGVLPGRFSNAGAVRRLLGVVFLALAAVAVARWRRLLPPEASAWLTTSAGSLRLPRERAAVTAEALAYLGSRARAGDGLSGFPEGGFFNFVTGLVNPLRQEQVYPGHLDRVREARVVRRIERAGPRFVVLVNRPAPAFGPSSFGLDYAVRLWEAVERRYRLAAAFGQAPPDATVGWPRFFIRVYERNP